MHALSSHMVALYRCLGSPHLAQCHHRVGNECNAQPQSCHERITPHELCGLHQEERRWQQCAAKFGLKGVLHLKVLQLQLDMSPLACNTCQGAVLIIESGSAGQPSLETPAQLFTMRRIACSGPGSVCVASRLRMVYSHPL